MMKRWAPTTLLVLTLLLVSPPGAKAIVVTLVWQAQNQGLMDENMAWLEDGDIVHLVYDSASDGIDYPDLYSGLPRDDDILLATATIAGGAGKFTATFSYPDSRDFEGDVVYVRFFNAPVMGQVTYYGLSPLHTVSEDFFQTDIWDMTEGGLYLWTAYPFIVIPEPETWLTLLPALCLGMLIYHRVKNRTNPRARRPRANR